MTYFRLTQAPADPGFLPVDLGGEIDEASGDVAQLQFPILESLQKLPDPSERPGPSFAFDRTAVCRGGVSDGLTNLRGLLGFLS